MRYFFLKTFFLLVSLNIYAQDANKLSPAFKKALNRFSNDPALKYATWGLTIKNLDTNEYILELNSDKSLTPASTLKTVTTSTALAFLGEDFRFETLLQYDGYIDDQGTLHGNIYIKGGGDPTLGFRRAGQRNNKYNTVVKKWVQAIQNAGIKKINGSVVGDATIFEMATVSPKWIWEDIGNYYGAGPSGLSFHENKYNLSFKSGTREGQPTQITGTTPEQTGITIVNEVTTGAPGSGDQAYIFAAPYSDLIFVRGTVPPTSKEFYIMGTIPDPPFFCAQSLKNGLTDKGIDVLVDATTMRKLNRKKSDPNRKTIHTNKSMPLSEIVYWANRKSINLYCEHLLKMLGHKVYHHGSTYNGLRVINNYWKRKRIKLRGFNIEDGSGLSPMNAVTTRNLVEILEQTYHSAYFGAFDRSLINYGKFTGKTGQTQNLRAKSGYIQRVRSFSGYIENECGDMMAFSFICNNFHVETSTISYKMKQVMNAMAKLEGDY